MDILQKIEVLDNFLKDYQNKVENGKMNDFIKRLEAYLREEVEIPFSKRFQSENSINLMTYHKSKGLEFDYVFVYNAGRYRNRSQESLYVPVDLIDINLSDENEKSRNEEEKRRLLYVAMTRAKKKLYLTDIVTDGKGDSKNKFKGEINPISEAELKKTPNIAAPVISSIYKLTENDYTRFESLNISSLAIKDEELFEVIWIDDHSSDSGDLILGNYISQYKPAGNWIHLINEKTGKKNPTTNEHLLK